MADTTLLARLQRATSAIPGGRALKRQLHNDVNACGLTYWWDTKQQQPGAAIMMYHRILERPDPFYPDGLPLETFRTQLEFFSRFSRVLSLDEAVGRLAQGRPLPPRCVVLTFDDGFRDTLTLAWPLLKRYRLPATLYASINSMERGVLWPDLLRHLLRTGRPSEVTLETLRGTANSSLSFEGESDRVRTAYRVGRYLKTVPDDHKWRVLEELTEKLLGMPLAAVSVPGLMLSWDELRALHQDGMAIGAHTVSHPILTQMPEPDAAREVVQSKQVLEARLNTRIDHFCYPNGQPNDFSPELEEAVSRAQFRSATSTIPGINRGTKHLFALRRIDGVQPSLRTLLRALEYWDQ